MTAFWDKAPCGLIEVQRCFKECTIYIIKVINKLHAKNQVEIQELVGPGAILAGSMEKADD
jgi:hypothetical protein